MNTRVTTRQVQDSMQGINVMTKRFLHECFTFNCANSAEYSEHVAIAMILYTASLPIAHEQAVRNDLTVTSILVLRLN